MAGHQFLLIMFLTFLGVMALIYLIISVSENYFSLSKQRERDRAIMEALGENNVNYSNPYYDQLSRPTQVAENLPTRSCHNCGAALEPQDRFCSICGTDKTTAE